MGKLVRLRVFVFPLLILYPLYAGVMFGEQEQILFPASSDKHYPLDARLPSTGRLVEVSSSFGKVRMFYQAAAVSSKAQPALVYTHGNFECIQDSFALVRPLVDAGISVLQLEFPGFCGADGDPSFANLVAAANAAYDWLADQPEVDKRGIVAMGYSIGGGVASELTRTRAVRALVLLSTYTSVKDVAHRYLLPGFLVRYPFDNLARLREYTGPAFLEHGKRDPVLPFAMGQELARSKPGSEFVALDCGHDDCHFDRSVFAGRLPAWFAANGILDHPAAEYGLLRDNAMSALHRDVSGTRLMETHDDGIRYSRP
jgi:pimeloyl-ACP methyl ester carboxylesterase